MSWTCPICERELLKVNQIHYCIKVGLDTLFAGRSPELILVFDKILAEVAGWDDVLISTSKNCIVFVHKQTFFVIRPMQKQLDLKFYSKTRLEGPMIFKSAQNARRFENNVRISALTELNMQLFGLIRDSYILL
ncbi:hypothetical protein SAMN05216490_4371 [Mucilaginibacter mallensis]|uniref:DUF5655 domain-containing protein n=1 Tax=Mucilaginibacter mallensis TaxID=652787 RepID=A0A1H2BV57_MUCMA|nr:DUF5655 domain-containing protein [Mucilaginibacter mallensis]SDT61942.1 hypothetical protein SAMN05216490_4371 [Mucilaginibacter mallensis]